MNDFARWDPILETLVPGKVSWPHLALGKKPFNLPKGKWPALLTISTNVYFHITIICEHSSPRQGEDGRLQDAYVFIRRRMPRRTKKWCADPDLNWGHLDFQQAASRGGAVISPYATT